MFRIIVVAIICTMVGFVTGAAIILKLYLWPMVVPPATAVVDLAGIVEHQRAEALKAQGDPEAMEKMVQQRMVRLAAILAELGQRRVILNKPAVVSGMLPDLTGQVEEQLSASGVSK
jgi:Type-F conjugative transfer system protein (TrbI_Ftype)